MYFYCLGYIHLYAKNCQIWWRFDEVLIKTTGTFFLAHPVYLSVSFFAVNFLPRLTVLNRKCHMLKVDNYLDFKL